MKKAAGFSRFSIPKICRTLRTRLLSSSVAVHMRRQGTELYHIEEQRQSQATNFLTPKSCGK